MSLSHEIVRYARTQISVYQSLYFLRQHLGHLLTEEELRTLLGEVLREVFDKLPKTYGQHQGPIGCFKSMRMLSAMEEIAVCQILQETANSLIAEITNIFPRMTGDWTHQAYQYAGDDYIIYYYPVTPSTCSRIVYEKAVDQDALRYLDTRFDV